MKLTQIELDQIVKDHGLWLRGDGGKLADLSYADLRSADLRSANLRSADLSYADLSNANLRSANLRSADLSNADLRSANLSYADLSYADLSYASLWGTRGNMRQVKSLQIEKYSITYTKDRLQIGCENHSIEKWRMFGDKQIAGMDTGALKWWRRWKETLFSIIEESPAE